MIERAQIEKGLFGPAYILDSELEWLWNCAAECRDPVIEIGVAYGGSTSCLLLAAPEGTQVISIDPFVVDSMSDWKANEDACRNGVARVLTSMRRQELLLRWELNTVYNREYVAGLPDDFRAGMVFVDGDHRYEEVNFDVQTWLPRIVPGGWLLLHDSNRPDDYTGTGFCSGWPGPTQVAAGLRTDPRVEFVASAHALTVWKAL